MAVGRLSGRWILEVLRSNHPEGVLRRALLDQFAILLVSSRSSPGAKGRLARRLYSRLNALQRRGLVDQEEGVVRPVAPATKAPPAPGPVAGPLLRRKLFRVLLAEDRDPGALDAAELRTLRWEFLACAVEAGWTLPQAAAEIGLAAAKAAQIIARPRG